MPDGVGQHVLHGPDQDVGQVLTGPTLPDDADRPVDPAGQVGEEDLVFAGEIVEEGLGGHVRGRGDLGDCGLVVPLLLEQPHGSAD